MAIIAMTALGKAPHLSADENTMMYDGQVYTRQAP
jgi:hypothetical protein